MRRLNSLPLFILLLAALAPVSCRTYGGYGTEEATLQQIEAAYAAFDRDLAQAKNDLRLVLSAGASDARAAEVARRLEAVVLVHDAMVPEHAELVEEARENADSYRFLNRTLGGMLSDQQVVYLQYADILRSVESYASTDTAEARPGSDIPRYHVVPPYYGRQQHASYIRPVGNVARALAAAGPSALASGAPTVADTTGSPASLAPADTTAGE